MTNFEGLKRLRQRIYESFGSRRDANMNLLDALSSYGHCCSRVVELSESPYFERQYSSITDGVADGLNTSNWEEIMKGVYQETGGKEDRVVFIADCTSNPRPRAETLADRHITHYPNPAPGNKPICEGHQYSIITMVPDCQEARKKHWMVPLLAKRVPSDKKGNEIGMSQIKDCIQTLGLQDKLVVSIGDSLYSTQACRQTISEHANWVHLFRLNSTRNLYAKAESSEHTKGNIRRYGHVMKLNQADTHPKADEVFRSTIVTSKGKTHTLSIK